MAEYTNPAAFEKAKKAYENVQLFLNGTVDAYLEDTGDTDFKRDVFLRQYDYALQCMLFAVVLGDGVAHPEELQAIKEIAQNGDLMEMISNDRVQWTWDEHGEASPYLVAKFQMKLEDQLEDIIDNFSQLIVISASRTDGKAYIDTLLDLTTRIAENIAAVDGELDDNEHDLINLKINEIFLESFRRI